LHLEEDDLEGADEEEDEEENVDAIADQLAGFHFI
jgi:hypothetical protein